MENKLYRSKSDKMVFGVCGGIAEYLRVDSTLIRIITILLFFTGVWIFGFYIILGIIIPENPSQKKVKSIKIKKDSKMLGFGLIIIGIILFINSYININWFQVWPILLILLGVFLLWQNQKIVKEK